MDGILIQYEYKGDESEWQAVVNQFISDINNDPELKGRFFYSVFKASEPAKRVHVGRWDSNRTLEILRQKAFFKTFSESIQRLAGESLSSIRLQAETETN